MNGTYGGIPVVVPATSVGATGPHEQPHIEVFRSLCRLVGLWSSAHRTAGTLLYEFVPAGLRADIWLRHTRSAERAPTQLSIYGVWLHGTEMGMHLHSRPCMRGPYLKPIGASESLASNEL
jgi:hypothetical protein